MTDTATQVHRLIKMPLRLPTYMVPAADALREQAESIANSLTEYLKKDVYVSDIDLSRTLCSVPLANETDGNKPTVQEEKDSDDESAPAPQIDDDLYFDSLIIGGEATMRVVMTSEDMATIATALFQGEVDEPMLNATVAQAVIGRVAECVNGMAFMLGATTDVVKSPPTPLSDKPMLLGNFLFSMKNEKTIRVRIEVSRTFTDSMAPPSAPPPTTTVESMKFGAKAVLVQQDVTVKMARQWQPGDVIPLPSARLDGILLEANTPNGVVPIAMTEMGTDQGVRSLRVISTEDLTVAPAPSTSSAGPDMGPDMGMDFGGDMEMGMGMDMPMDGMEADPAALEDGTGDMPFDAAPMGLDNLETNDDEMPDFAAMPMG